MRLLIVGAGATGGYFGGRLAQAGRDVTFLVRPSRAAQLRDSGLQLLSPHGDVTVQPRLVTAEEIAAPYDAVLMTVKAFGLDAAIQDVAPAVGPDTMVMPVLNGMRHLDALIARFGETPVIGGVCLVASTIDPQGRIRQLAGFQALIYGERAGGMSARIQALHGALSGAGFDARVSETIMQEMWEKWILLATLGSITCLLRGSVGEIEAAPGGAELAVEAMDECVAVAAASGYRPGEAYLARTRAAVTQKGSPSSPSMYRDLNQGLPVEADQIVGDMLKRAQGFGIDAPVLKAAYAALCVYQNRVAKG